MSGTTRVSRGAPTRKDPRAWPTVCARCWATRTPGSSTVPAICPTPTPRPHSFATAAETLGGRVDILVANHALSGSDGALDAINADMLDAHWAIDARSVILLVQAYARLRAGFSDSDDGRTGVPGGRIMMMTSGQDLGAGMPYEIAYSLAKGALASATRSLATTLADLAVTVNTVNPGPVDTGYLEGAEYEQVAAMFPAGRWGLPDDPARLIAWLATDEAAWITGQVIDSEGGFRR